MGWSPKRREDIGVALTVFPLAQDEGRRGSLCQDLPCLSSLQDRAEEGSGLLQPLPILKRPWQCLSMVFISGFPKVEGFRSVLVVVDRFSKYAVFIPAPSECPTDVEKGATLLQFEDQINKYARLNSWRTRTTSSGGGFVSPSTR